MVEGARATENQARQWAAIIHVSGIAGLLVSGFGLVLAPLVLWLIKRNDHEFIDDQGKEAVNFQLTMLLGILIGLVLTFILVGLVILLIVGIMAIVYPIIAAIKASEGIPYRYPYTLRLIK